MKRSVGLISLLVFVATLVGCGGSSNDGSEATLSGVAAIGAPVLGTVHVQGAGAEDAEITTDTNSDGYFSVNVAGLTAPFMVYVVPVDASLATLYSAAPAPGTVNITPVTDFVLRKALNGVPEEAAWAGEGGAAGTIDAMTLNAAAATVAAQLAPMFDAAGVADFNPFSGQFAADGTGFDALLDILEISYAGTTATVTNTATGSSFIDDIADTTDDAEALLPKTQQEVDDTVAALTVFRAEAFDQISKIYIQYPADDAATPNYPNGTTQEEVTLAGSGGSYTATIVTSYFDSAGTFISADAPAEVQANLEADGTLVSPLTPGVHGGITWTLVKMNTGSYLVSAVETDESDATQTYSYSNTWHLDTPPAGWLTDTGASASGFTAALLDPVTTIYMSYPSWEGDPGYPGTTQSVTIFSGSNGNYTAENQVSFFDADGAFVQDALPMEPFSVTLNPGGSLTNGFGDTLTLVESSGNALTVHVALSAAAGGHQWDEVWHLNAPPAGWLEGGGATPPPTQAPVFTDALLGSISKMYSVNTSSNGQTEMTLTGGNGVYQYTYQNTMFDHSGTVTGTEPVAGPITLTLQADGTLESSIGVSWTLLEDNGDSLLIQTTAQFMGTSTNTDTYYLASKPAGWKPSPTSFTAEWLNGKTLYAVWYGTGYDAQGNELAADVPVVAKEVFANGTANITGLMNHPDVSGSYGVTGSGLLYYEGVTTEGNKINCSTEDYLLTHYTEDGVFDNIDLYFFEEAAAMSFANSLTGQISSSCN